jgi:hypothetical protein
MTRETWLDVVARLSAEEPFDLDPILTGHVTLPGEGAPPVLEGATVRSTKLWRRDETVSCIGIRIDRAPEDPRRLALRLASAAAERGVVPIILTTLPRTGLEQYGFRVERLPDGPPEATALFETELRKFWDMPIVVSLSDVERLG